MNLSITVKESIKTSLAMTIAYGIALSQDWDKPLWAGFAVAFVSLSTSGQSFNKSAMRMLGTLISVTMTLVFIALFPQDRWLFMLTLSLYVGFCTYMMAGPKYQYFWFVCGYVCIIIGLEAGPNSVNAFTLAIIRAQETGLGILVYSVITALLWRSNSADKFKTVSLQLQKTQHQLYRRYFNLMNGQDDSAEIKSLMTQAMQQLAQFKVLLLAAETDSYEINELKQQWERYQSQIVAFGVLLERWHDSFVTVKTLDIQFFMPNLSTFDQMLEQHFVEMRSLLEGNAPSHLSQATELQLNENELNKLSHFQKAALLAIHTNLCELKQLTLALYNSLADIKGFSERSIAPSHKAETLNTGFTIDIDRLGSYLQAMAGLWLTFLIFIYVEGIPGGIGLVIYTGVIGMPLAANANMRVSALIIPLAGSVLFVGALYSVVMPQLTSFVGLGIMLFVVTFILCYLFASPQQGLSRTLALSLFVTMISVNNQQSYNILNVYNTALEFAMMVVVFFIVSYIPFSHKPEQAFSRLLSRFFRSSEYLMSTHLSRHQHVPSFWQKKRTDFHLQDLKTLPNKIAMWSQMVNTEATGASKEQLDAITTHVQLISLRLIVLLEARANPQSPVLMNELWSDGHVWRQGLQDTFQRLSKNPMIENQAEWQAQLVEIMASLELCIANTLDKVEEEQLSRMDEENFYRLLGAYRGVSDATFEYSSTAQLINWDQWNESRF